MQGWEQQVRTGHPEADHAEVQRLDHAARSQGLAVAVLPLPGGGFHVRAYPTWAADPNQVAVPPHHPQQGHPQPGHPQQGHPQPGHPQQGHPQPAQQPQQGHPQPVQQGPTVPHALSGPLAAAGALATPEGQASIRDTLHYAAQGSAAELMMDLGQLAILDKNSEKLQKKWGWFSAGGCLVVFVGIPLGILLVPLFALCVLGLVFFIVAIGRYGKFKKTNLEDRRYQLAARVVRLLSADVDPNAPMKLSIGLGSTERKECAVGQNNVMGWDVTYYRDAWLSVAGKLADGSSFKLDQVELLQVRKKRKVNYRGKVKHKRKDKHGLLCTLTLKYKDSRYPAMATLAGSAFQAVQLPHGAMLKQLTPQPGSLALKVTSKVPWTVPQPGAQAYQELNAMDLVAMMFLSAYQVLNLAKRVGGNAPPAA